MPGPIALIVDVVSLVLALAAVLGLIDAVRYPSAAFTFVGRIPKPAWLAILAVSAVLIWWSPLSILGLAGIIATAYYFADTRRKIRELKGI